MGFLRLSFGATLALCALIVGSGIALTALSGSGQSEISILGAKVTTANAGVAAIVVGAALCALAIRRHLDSYDKLPAAARSADLKARRRRRALTITIAIGAVPVALTMSVRHLGGPSGDAASPPVSHVHQISADPAVPPDLDAGVPAMHLDTRAFAAQRRVTDGGVPDMARVEEILRGSRQ
jgi:hypothetical protein